MSYLIRSGDGRTNISWSTVANTSTKYLRRTSSGRNNIVWTTIPSGSTYNILNRTGTGRNNIAWGNLQIKSRWSELFDLIALFNGNWIHNRYRLQIHYGCSFILNDSGGYYELDDGTRNSSGSEGGYGTPAVSKTTYDRICESTGKDIQQEFESFNGLVFTRIVNKDNVAYEDCYFYDLHRGTNSDYSTIYQLRFMQNYMGSVRFAPQSYSQRYYYK